MTRAILLAIGAVAVAAAAIPALVVAQGAPPGPPATFWGSVPAGVGPGQSVIAIVSVGGASQTCGFGATIADGAGGVAYVVDVISESQRAGCGAAGRTVQFYFVGNRQMATDTATWGGPGPAQRNLTGLGPTLTPRNITAMVAKDNVP
jgi:hypothetical protein